MNNSTEHKEPLLDAMCINFMVILATTFKTVHETAPQLDRVKKVELAESLAWDLARKIPYGVMLSGSRSIPINDMNNLEEVIPDPKPTRRIIKSKAIDNRHETA